MAAPLSGIATQQQTPAAQALQPAAADQTRAVREPERTSRENEVQPVGAETSSVQATTLSERSFEDTIQDISSPQEASPEPRGSRLDISV